MYGSSGFIESKYGINQPWEIIESLRKWCNYIYDSFGSLMMKFPLEKQEELRTKSNGNLLYQLLNM